MNASYKAPLLSKNLVHHVPEQGDLVEFFWALRMQSELDESTGYKITFQLYILLTKLIGHNLHKESRNLVKYY
jgi:hypothetical protein